ncbi:MAG TPA: acyl-CoA dehydrogenase family protein, partial [Burkholderiales bacterium]|nr:acyl-CoA dehydrogenase family protein [Burkholderiales bacterium]
MILHPAITEAHEAYRETVRRFVEREILPYATAWDEAGEFPRELYRKAAAAGLFAPGFPEEYGGMPADYFFRIQSAEEFARA